MNDAWRRRHHRRPRVSAAARRAGSTGRVAARRVDPTEGQTERRAQVETNSSLDRVRKSNEPVSPTERTSAAAEVSSLRRRYLRPLRLAILFSVLGESTIFVVWGLLLYPEGNVPKKFLWTIVFCGLGMGGALGSLVALLVVDRLSGWRAVAATVSLSTPVLGVGCNLLCLELDQHFLYFGGAENSPLFIWDGVVMSAVGGAALGWLCFTEAGSCVGVRARD